MIVKAFMYSFQAMCVLSNNLSWPVVPGLRESPKTYIKTFDFVCFGGIFQTTQGPTILFCRNPLKVPDITCNVVRELGTFVFPQKASNTPFFFSCYPKLPEITIKTFIYSFEALEVLSNVLSRL